MYLHSLYFMVNTFSHVALGDITSISTEEKILNTFIMWIFVFFYAFCFANIASIVSDLLGNNFLQFHERFQYATSKLNLKNTPDTILTNVNTYYDYIWAKS